MNNFKFLLFGTSLSFLPTLSLAQCVETTNCETLGYTENSCNNGKGLKCPFGEKWLCARDEAAVCDENGFKYSCTGTGYSGGSGDSCGGKYKKCNCAEDYENKNNTCIKISKPDFSGCVTGTLFYSDNTCSANLETDKELLGIVIYERNTNENGWIMTINPITSNIIFGGYAKDIPDLPNYTSTPIDVQNSCTNTNIITSYGNSNTYPVAWATKNYKPKGTPAGKEWCLPSGGLLNNINNQTNFTKINNGIRIAKGTILGSVAQSGDTYYEHIWTSSEYNLYDVWHFFADTKGNFNIKNHVNKNNNADGASVRAVLPF